MMTSFRALLVPTLLVCGLLAAGATPAGAVPVYPGDDIQAALDANSSVELQPGDYYLSAPLNMPGNTVLSGAGGETVLHINDGLDPPAYGSAIDFNGDAGGNFSTVRDLTIVGGGVGMGWQAHDNVVSGLEIRDVIPPPTEDGHGVVVSGGAGPSYNNLIVNNRVANVHHGIGISLDGGSHHNVVQGNWIANADMSGITVESYWRPPLEAPHDNIIDGNTLEDCILAVAAGFSTNRAQRNQVTNNIVRRPVWWLYPTRVLFGHFFGEDDPGLRLPMAGIVAIHVGEMHVAGNAVASAQFEDILVCDAVEVSLDNNLRDQTLFVAPAIVLQGCQ
jgi:hypothetical protein